MSVIEFDWYINNSWLEPWPCSHHSSGTTKCSASGEIKIPQKASVNKNKRVINKINKNKSQRDHKAHIKLDKKYAEPRCSHWPRSALNCTLAIQHNGGNHRSVQGFSICIAKIKKLTQNVSKWRRISQPLSLLLNKHCWLLAACINLVHPDGLSAWAHKAELANALVYLSATPEGQ